jgi:hypothetical protein
MGTLSNDGDPGQYQAHLNLGIPSFWLISFWVRGSFYVKTMSARQRARGFWHEEWRNFSVIGNCAASSRSCTVPSRAALGTQHSLPLHSHPCHLLVPLSGEFHSGISSPVPPLGHLSAFSSLASCSPFMPHHSTLQVLLGLRATSTESRH